MGPKITSSPTGDPLVSECGRIYPYDTVLRTEPSKAAMSAGSLGTSPLSRKDFSVFCLLRLCKAFQIRYGRIRQNQFKEVLIENQGNPN